MGRRGAWGVTVCFEQTEQIKKAYPFGRSAAMLKNRKILGRRSFFGGLLNLGPAYITCKRGICWGGTLPGTHARRGATVPTKLQLGYQQTSEITDHTHFLYHISLT